jgi:hypothetical protein
MTSVFSFIVKPVGERYNNKIKIDGKDLIINTKIESFQIPAYCSTCGEQKIYLLRSGKEFHPGEKLEFEMSKCEKDDCAIGRRPRILCGPPPLSLLFQAVAQALLYFPQKRA